MSQRRGFSQVEQQDMALGRSLRKMGPEMGQAVAMFVSAMGDMAADACSECGRPFTVTGAYMLCAELSESRDRVTIRYIGPECSAAHNPEWTERTH